MRLRGVAANNQEKEACLRRVVNIGIMESSVAFHQLLKFKQFFCFLHSTQATYDMVHRCTILKFVTITSVIYTLLNIVLRHYSKASLGQ
jgi:hypothetical protein